MRDHLSAAHARRVNKNTATQKYDFLLDFSQIVHIFTKYEPFEKIGKVGGGFVFANKNNNVLEHVIYFRNFAREALDASTSREWNSRTA